MWVQSHSFGKNAKGFHGRPSSSHDTWMTWQSRVLCVYMRVCVTCKSKACRFFSGWTIWKLIYLPPGSPPKRFSLTSCLFLPCVNDVLVSSLCVCVNIMGWVLPLERAVCPLGEGRLAGLFCLLAAEVARRRPNNFQRLSIFFYSFCTFVRTVHIKFQSIPEEGSFLCCSSWNFLHCFPFNGFLRRIFQIKILRLWGVVYCPGLKALSGQFVISAYINQIDPTCIPGQSWRTPL